MEWLNVTAWLNEETWVKLGLAAALGFIIGLERELKRKPLGLKTSSVIAIVSCLLTIVSMESAYLATGRTDGVNVTMDPLRLAAQIVSGIGFLGAGAILRRGNDHITGLTTAAMIWGAAGIGIAVGAGFYYEAIAVVILMIASVKVVPFLLGKPMQQLKTEHWIQLTVESREMLESILEKMETEKIKITQSKIKDLKRDALHMLELRVKVKAKRGIADLYRTLSAIDGVVSVEISN